MTDGEDLRVAATLPAVDAREITGCYHGAAALDRASVPVREGEIHTQLREADGRKSRLISMISGATKPDDKTIDLEKRESHVR